MSFYLKFFILFFVVFVSCTSSGKEDLESAEGADSGGSAIALDFDKILELIPTKNLIVNTVTTANSQYNPELLNNPDIANRYNTEQSQALNLGVYGSDLNVTSVYEQAQESIIFLKCVNLLSKNLGIANAFDDKMAERMDVNKENRDSSLEIISQSFKTANHFLKENGRENTSTLIVVGAWVEGIYIACKVGKETSNQEIVKEILSQKASLQMIVQSLESSKLSDNLNYLVDDLKSVLKLIESKKGPKLSSIEDLNDIDLKITEVRTKIVSIN